MKVDLLNPLPINKVPFNHYFFKHVPKENGCYVLTTFDNMILYIGLTKNLNTRFLQHLDSSIKTTQTESGKASWFYFLLYDPNNLPKLERTWLNQYLWVHGKLPVLNLLNSPIG